MISVNQLAMRYGQRTLFEGVQMHFSVGHRYGLVGANGSGKSTFLAIMASQATQSGGDVTIPKHTRVGFLKQDQFQYEDETVLNTVIRGKKALWDAMHEKQVLLSHGEIDQTQGQRLATLEEIIGNENGYSAESFAGEILEGLGLKAPTHLGLMKQLSGGFKLRVLLAQALFQQPDLLLLDEPTNHLDILSIRWLEQFLVQQFEGVLLVISHDRQFLDSLCTHICDVDYETITIYPGNYEDFILAKELQREQILRENSNSEKRMAEMQAFVDRFRAKASKARQAQSRLKQMDRIELSDLKQSSRIEPNFHFVQKRPAGKEILQIKNIGKQFGEKVVLKNISLEVLRGDKVAIIGPNGIGKSTLLKILIDQLKPDAGSYEWGYETYFSYFVQDHHEALQGNINIYDWLYSFFPTATIGQIRGMLGRVLFSGDDVYKSIQSMSGGEAARLLLARIMLEENNILILDEPTNHLDLEGIDALERSLVDYPGTLLIVSHDRHFVRSIANRIWELTPDGVRDFRGSYEDYLASQGDDYLHRDATHLHTKADDMATQKTQSKLILISPEERKELKKKLHTLGKKTSSLEERIAKKELAISTIQTAFADPNFYQQTAAAQVRVKQDELNQHQQDLENILKEWETASADLEQAKHRLEAAGIKVDA